MQTTHDLEPRERPMLRRANELLTELTVNHSHTCQCELCVARMLTDVQEEESFHVKCEVYE
jgi:hypothetical protein